MSDTFQSLAHYLKEAAGLTSSHFLKDHNHPVLLWSLDLDWTEEITFQFDTSIFKSESTEPASLPTDTGSQMIETLVIEVRKQVGSGPANMICVGRAVNNDIIFAHEMVSKLHAYFLKKEGEDTYEIVDAGSTNGTSLNNQSLIAHSNNLLVNGDRLHFGSTIGVMYLTANGFYEFLQHLLRSGIF